LARQVRVLTKLSDLPALALLVALSACGAKPAKPPPRAPEVGYVTVTAQTVPLEIELPGRTSAYETSDVRPQVSGLIQERRFVEGGIVRKDQTLYQIDPSLYRAAVAQAQASLANAEAIQVDTAAKAARFKPLADIEAVAKQDYVDAQALANEAVAQVALAKAALDTARINLRFTRIPAPITGRIGRSLVTTGALVTVGQTNALSSIQRLDPIFVDIPQSSADLVALRRELASGGSTPSAAAVRLTLEDGSAYATPGRIEFSEPMVDMNTGTVILRATFPNPTGLLLPGMYVRAHLSQVTAQNAILAPQQGVARDPKGNATVYLVGPGNKWLVASGLAPGDKVITEGLDKVKPNQPVHPVPAGSAPRPAPSAKNPAPGANSPAPGATNSGNARPGY
jgi:membrane fusion protein (multidrug efflux system)